MNQINIGWKTIITQPNPETVCAVRGCAGGGWAEARRPEISISHPAENYVAG